MSVDQKQNMVLKNVEEERAQLEANKNKFVDDKPARKIEEEPPAEGPVINSGDESSEENKSAETAKKNAINTDKTSQALQPSSKPQVSSPLWESSLLFSICTASHWPTSYLRVKSGCHMYTSVLPLWPTLQ